MIILQFINCPKTIRKKLKKRHKRTNTCSHTVCLFPTDIISNNRHQAVIKASQATAVHIVEMRVERIFETILWFSSTPPSRTLKGCRNTWFRAGWLSWKASADSVTQLHSHCSATRPSLTATHQVARPLNRSAGTVWSTFPFGLFLN